MSLLQECTTKGAFSWTLDCFGVDGSPSVLLPALFWSTNQAMWLVKSGTCPVLDSVQFSSGEIVAHILISPTDDVVFTKVSRL